MINETVQLTQFVINQSAGAIPLKVTLDMSQNWSQFFSTIITALITSFGLLLIVYFKQIKHFFKGSGSLKKLARLTGRNVIMIKHTESGLFSMAMINEETIREVAGAISKFKGRDFDLILHTPGGDIFSSMYLSRLFKNYPGEIRCIIPLYSMSGGSLLALSCDKIYMNPTSCIGPIDPQLGNLFKYGSAKSWDYIVKMKGKKAEDQSISFSLMGRQYTKSIRNHLVKSMDFGMSQKQKERFASFLTDGNIEHAYPLTIPELLGFGLKVHEIDKRTWKILDKLVTSSAKEGVYYYGLKNKKWKEKKE